MNTVLVLAGGTSDEREVSLRSGNASAEALRAAGYEVTELDANNPIDIILKAAQNHDVVFLALHGSGGEDGTLQKEFEALHIPFVGSGSAASKLCFDKWEYSKVIIANQLPTPATLLVSKDAFNSAELRKKPYVLKPNDGGSSIDTIIAREPNTVTQAQIDTVFERHSTMLLQELITGAEITVAILGEQALPVIEIIPPTQGEFDYQNKYNGASQEICPPLNIGHEHQELAQKLSLQAHLVTGCQDLSRTDFMISEQGELYILETNTIPGLTPQSLYPKAAATAGISMPDLMDTLVQFALSRTN